MLRILYIVFLSLGLTACASYQALSLMDDAYYVSGDEMRMSNVRIAEGNSDSSPSKEYDKQPCQPTIIFTSVQDTVVKAVIHRCPAP